MENDFERIKKALMDAIEREEDPQTIEGLTLVLARLNELMKESSKEQLRIKFLIFLEALALNLISLQAANILSQVASF